MRSQLAKKLSAALAASVRPDGPSRSHNHRSSLLKAASRARAVEREQTSLPFADGSPVEEEGEAQSQRVEKMKPSGRYFPRLLLETERRELHRVGSLDERYFQYLHESREGEGGQSRTLSRQNRQAVDGAGNGTSRPADERGMREARS